MRQLNDILADAPSQRLAPLIFIYLFHKYKTRMNQSRFRRMPHKGGMLFLMVVWFALDWVCLNHSIIMFTEDSNQVILE